MFRKHETLPFKQIVQCRRTRHPFVPHGTGRRAVRLERRGLAVIEVESSHRVDQRSSTSSDCTIEHRIAEAGGHSSHSTVALATGAAGNVVVVGTGSDEIPCIPEL